MNELLSQTWPPIGVFLLVLCLLVLLGVYIGCKWPGKHKTKKYTKKYHKKRDQIGFIGGVRRRPRRKPLTLDRKADKSSQIRLEFNAPAQKVFELTTSVMTD